MTRDRGSQKWVLRFRHCYIYALCNSQTKWPLMYWDLIQRESIMNWVSERH